MQVRVDIAKEDMVGQGPLRGLLSQQDHVPHRLGLRPRGRLILVSDHVGQPGARLFFLIQSEVEMVGIGTGPLQPAMDYLARREHARGELIAKLEKAGFEFVDAGTGRYPLGLYVQLGDTPVIAVNLTPLSSLTKFFMSRGLVIR